MARRLAAILAADVVGYSRLMEQDEAGTLAALKAHRSQFIDPLIANHGGRIVKLMGDGALVEFPSVVDAVACAVAVQQGMAARDAETPEDNRIVFRIGVNLGDVVIDGDDIYGDGVNVAARLETMAEPGGVCISGTVHEHIAGKLDQPFADAGEQTVKNIARPIRVWRWSTGGAAQTGQLRTGEALPLPDKPSIAVLPFTNMSGDPEQEYFSDGITEDIITELSRFPSLFVIARNSSFTFKGKAVDVTEVGRRLGVEYVVEGSVRKAGARVRITAQLVEAASGRHIWAERYDRQLEDIFAVQDEVVEVVASNLGRSLRDTTFARVRARPLGGLSAYEHLLRGRAAWWSGDFSDAFSHVERALEADPGYAAAHAWLALQYTYDQFKGELDLTIEERTKRAHHHAGTALQLDDRDAFVHMAVSMAFCFTLDSDRARALRHSDTAIALNPHDFECMYCRAYVLAANGRYAEALDWLNRASRLSPVASYLLAEGYSDFYLWMGEYEKGLAVILVQDRVPANTYLHIAIVYILLGRTEEARPWIERFERERPDHFDVCDYLRFLINVYFRDMRFDDALQGLRKAGWHQSD